jgi:hypothetical protein
LFDPEMLDACVESGVRERLPEKGLTYSAYIDAASGSGTDSFAVAIAHEDTGRCIIDCVRRWTPPFNPSSVIAECSALLRKYHVYTACGDRFAYNFVIDGFRQCGITFRLSELNTVQTYLEFVSHVNAQQVMLLDRPDVMKELRGLERRRGTGGRDRVDHRPGQHDDMAAACSGVTVLLSSPANQAPFMWNYLTGEVIHPDFEEQRLLLREARTKGVSVESVRARWDPVPNNS